MTVREENLTPVENSSNISGMLFVPYEYDESQDDPETGRLTIRFSSGAIYDFYDVPHVVGREIFEAESTGKYFHANIRGKYEAQKRLPLDPLEEQRDG